MSQHSIEVPEITNRFGVVSSGTPIKVNTVGPTTIYTPSSSNKRIRLTWFAMSTPPENTLTVIATVKMGNNVIYNWPLGSPSIFSHSSLRQGTYNESLTITLSVSGQDVYICLDVNEF